MTDFNHREWTLIRFALWRFANAAREHANAAAQDKDGEFFNPGAVDAFLKDARDAEAILTVLRMEAAAEPALGATPSEPPGCDGCNCAACELRRNAAVELDAAIDAQIATSGVTEVHHQVKPPSHPDGSTSPAPPPA